MSTLTSNAAAIADDSRRVVRHADRVLQVVDVLFPCAASRWRSAVLVVPFTLTSHATWRDRDVSKINLDAHELELLNEPEIAAARVNLRNGRPA